MAPIEAMKVHWREWNVRFSQYVYDNPRRTYTLSIPCRRCGEKVRGRRYCFYTYSVPIFLCSSCTSLWKDGKFPELSEEEMIWRLLGAK